MSEKIPSQHEENEEQVDLSKRGFLKGAIAVGTVAAVGGAALLMNRAEQGETVEKSVVSAPYEIAIETLNKQEVMEEIVHDELRIVRLNTMKAYGLSNNPSDNFDIQYFLDRYPVGAAPTHEEIEEEIHVLTGRIAHLRARRDQLSSGS